MNQATTTKLVLAAAGLMSWGYGIQSGQPFPKWLGIAMLAAAVVLRFVKRGDRTQ